MTYPPISSGFPPTQPPRVPGYPNSLPGHANEAKNGLLVSLRIIVIVLGVLIYLCSFGKSISAIDTDSLMTAMTVGTTLPVMPVVVLAILASLMTAVGLLPKTRDYSPIIVVLAVCGGLIGLGALSGMTQSNLSPGWALWVVVICAILQGIIAIIMLLFKIDLINLPVAQSRTFTPPYPYGLPPQESNFYGHSGHHGPPPGHPPVSPPAGVPFNASGTVSGATFGTQPTQGTPYPTPSHTHGSQHNYSAYGSMQTGGFAPYPATNTPSELSPTVSHTEHAAETAQHIENQDSEPESHSDQG